jgi:hypothetical protein
MLLTAVFVALLVSAVVGSAKNVPKSKAAGAYYPDGGYGGYGRGGAGYYPDNRPENRREYQVEGSVCSLQASYYLNGYYFRQPQFCRSTGSNSQSDCLACCQIATRLRSGIQQTDIQAFLATLPGFVNNPPPPYPVPAPYYGGGAGAGQPPVSGGYSTPIIGRKKRDYGDQDSTDEQYGGGDDDQGSASSEGDSSGGSSGGSGDSSGGSGSSSGVTPSPQCVCCVPSKRSQRYVANDDYYGGRGYEGRGYEGGYGGGAYGIYQR